MQKGYHAGQVELPKLFFYISFQAIRSRNIGMMLSDNQPLCQSVVKLKEFGFLLQICSHTVA